MWLFPVSYGFKGSIMFVTNANIAIFSLLIFDPIVFDISEHVTTQKLKFQPTRNMRIRSVFLNT